MTATAAQTKADAIARRFGRDAVILDSYRGSRLAPVANEAVATWDVTSHALREQARLGVTSPEGRTASY